jgi:hypothetical protein
MRLRASILLLASLLAAAGTAYSQSATGTISGTVTDSSGAVLPGAQVVILNEETGISRTLTTNEAGRYVAPALGLGAYRVTASIAGFQTSVRTGIVLTVGREAPVNFQLEVGAITQTVEVTGEAPLVEVTKGGLGTLVESQSIEELPLNGRDLAQLITLQTGAVEYTAADNDLGAGKLLVIGGSRPTTNVFMVDGVAIESFSQKTPTGTSGQFLGAEAVREFRVETNAYSAEFGRGAGGIFNVATKSGTNSLHGSVFEYLRNDNLDAYRWESKRLPGEEPEKPEFKRNQFGFSLGGPIVRDKTFFFGTYEGLRERVGSVSSPRTFSDALRSGILPNTTTPVQINSKVLPYLQSDLLWPRPPAGAPVQSDGTVELLFTRTTPTNEDLYQIRVDNSISESDSAFVRYTLLDSSRVSLLGFGNSRQELSVRSHSLALEESHIFSPALLNTFRFGFSRNVPIDQAIQDPPIPTNLQFVPRTGLMGSISISGTSLSGVGDAIPGEKRAVNSFQIADDMNYTRGRSTMKFGVHLNRVQFNGFNPGRDAAQYAFRSLRDFFNANPNGRFRGTVLDCCNDAHRSFRDWIIGLYYQNDFRMTPRLTVNMGMRYEFITVPTENHGRIGNIKGGWDVIYGATIDDIVVGNPWIENPSLKNFAPRLGFAWDATGDGRMALRGGFGLFFQQFDQSWYRTSGFRTPPILAEVDIAARSNQSPQAVIPFPDVYQLCGQENPFTGNVRAECRGAKAGPDMVAHKFSTPYVMQYNLNTQHQIGGNMVMTLGYAGSRGVRLPAVADFNSWAAQEENGRLRFPAAIVAADRRPGDYFDLIRIRHVGYNSWYNSMQLNVTRRFSQGLQMTGAYTFSKNIDEISGIQTASDTNSGPSTLPNPHHKDLYKGRSSFDAPHVFSFNSTYELPFGRTLAGVGKHLVGGWQVGGIVTMNTGFPATVSMDNRFATLGHGDEFPDLAIGASNDPTSGTSAGCGDIAPGTKLRTPDLWFDPCAFALPPDRTLGNLGRNTVTMPGKVTVDFNLAKNFDITESAKLQFRFEAFNLANHPNFGTPSTSVMDDEGVLEDEAGVIDSTVLTPRQLQFALKLTF